MNAVRLAEVRLVDTVDLSELDTLLLEAGRSLLVVGSKGLAVTAPGRICQECIDGSRGNALPRSEELNEHQRLRLDGRVEVGGVRSRTSEARTAWTNASTAADGNRRETRIVNGEEEEGEGRKKELGLVERRGLRSL